MTHTHTRTWMSRATWGACALALAGIGAGAHALDVVPYTPQALAQKQQAGQAVSLHFHAAWCPTCRTQEKVFHTFKGDASVPGTLLVVDHDAARELRRDLNVRSQSTLIVYKGRTETHRSGGETDAQVLRMALLSGQ